MIVSNPLFPNAFQPISVTVSGIVTSFNALQSVNVQTAIFVNPSGRVMISNPVFLNASLPISVIEFGNVIVFSA